MPESQPQTDPFHEGKVILVSEDAKAETWKAPYVSWETYDNFFEKKLGSGRVPPQIPPQFLDNYAGSVRPLILSALKTTGMIDENHYTQPALRKAVESREARYDLLRTWAESFYREQLEMAKRDDTAPALWDSFAKHDYSGSTLRKAVVFYLQLVEALGLPNSPYFKAPKAQQSTGVRQTRTRGGRGGTDAKGKPTSVPPPTGDAATSSTGNGEEVTVDLGDAGSVHIAVNVRWLSLDDDTANKLRKGIRELQALSLPHEPLAAGERPSDQEGLVGYAAARTEGAAM